MPQYSEVRSLRRILSRLVRLQIRLKNTEVYELLDAAATDLTVALFKMVHFKEVSRKTKEKIISEYKKGTLTKNIATKAKVSRSYVMVVVKRAGLRRNKPYVYKSKGGGIPTYQR